LIFACYVYYTTHMSPTERVITFRPDADILAAMETLKERDGTPYSEQVRRALRAWLEEKQVMRSVAKVTNKRRGAR
jgi:hypothetical protein